MKTMRKFMALVLTLAMALTLAIPALADGDGDGNGNNAKITDDVTGKYTYVITLNKTVAGYVYDAYQVFSGDLDIKDGIKTLSNIAWGSGVNGKDLLDALKAETTAFQITPDGATDAVNAFKDCTSAADVAEVLEDNKDTATFVEKFADIAGANLTTTVAGSSKATTQTVTAKDSDDDTKTTTTTTVVDYKIGINNPGYYLVKNSLVPQAAADATAANAATDIILEVVEPTVTVAPKDSVPSLEKTIDDNVKANAVSIGDVINYTVVGTMPSTLDDYNTYYYKFVDTMSKGLTYNGDLAITLKNGDDEKNITQSFGTGFYKNTDGETVLTAAITDILALNLFKNDSNVSTYPVTATSQIIFTYSATVNKDAVVGVSGNPNVANLIFSNDPTQSGTPTTTPPTPPEDNPPSPPDTPPVPPEDPPQNIPKPADGVVTGETPDSVTVSYLTAITVNKVDGDGNPLAGAEFSIAGSGVKYQYTTEAKYVAAKDGETAAYWQLADGTYTATAPTEDTINNYPAGTTLSTAASYVKTTETIAEFEYVDYAGTYKAEAVQNGNNYSMGFSGLGAGDYTITETKTPSGYNTAGPFTVKITFNAPDTVTADAKCSWTVEGAKYNATTGLISLDVENNKGSILPSTGGIGTTIFYAVGAVLVIGAGVLFITKKRMSGAED